MAVKRCVKDPVDGVQHRRLLDRTRTSRPPLPVTAWSDVDTGHKKMLTDSTIALGRRIGEDFRRLKLKPDGFEPT
ncbi:hypothetical protein [Mesorhizobium comanense]|uniref:hypothetical protein n=1 Tax=Mesorhizobium comanense TaxID=2502215 RepID=UPI0014859596|nr:hypothetical protein [Mesorhizobium comanense]